MSAHPYLEAHGGVAARGRPLQAPRHRVGARPRAALTGGATAAAAPLTLRAPPALRALKSDTAFQNTASQRTGNTQPHRDTQDRIKRELQLRSVCGPWWGL